MLLDTNTKLEILDQIYEVYDRFNARLSIACEKHCSHCCTANITMTTLEGSRIVQKIIENENSNLLDRIADSMEKDRFHPRITTNQLAELCKQDAEIPEEPDRLFDSQCTILDEDLCPLYADRPFGCRCLISRRKCGDSGYADIDDFILSVNTLFLQTIEHIDADGYSGNLIDVLQFLSVQSHRETYSEGKLDKTGSPLIRNHPMTALFVPPEHQKRMTPIIEALRNIRVPTA